MKIGLLIACWVFFAAPETVVATQAHGAPEGIYAHQFAHLFFLLSMVIFVYWLRQRKLVEKRGWLYIQYAALFFILWNFDVIVVHFLDEQAVLVAVEKVDSVHIRISSPLGRPAEIFYYLGKMDHFLCVPAMLFLFLGLRRLSAETMDESGGPARGRCTERP
jgi:hypothetical protein